MALADTIAQNFKLLQNTAGVRITYARGDVNITLTAIPSDTEFVSAIPSDTEFVSADGDGYMETVEARDFVFPASDLTIGGQPVLPDRGDTITETVNGQQQTYPVTNAGSGRYFKYSDPFRKIIRVHTKWTK